MKSIKESFYPVIAIMIIEFCSCENAYKANRVFRTFSYRFAFTLN